MIRVRHVVRTTAANVIAVLALATTGMVGSVAVRAQQDGSPAVTFTKDISLILQRSCQNCHRPDGAAPMPLFTYEDARPWARAIKSRTSLRDKRGAMPPWFIEKNVGIQQYKNDPSLSDEEITKIEKWADAGAPRGNPADMPPSAVRPGSEAWTIGTPDLILDSAEVLVTATQSDWWGELQPSSVPTGLTEDRYVSAVEIKEVNDAKKGEPGRATVGARFVFHHATYTLGPPGLGAETGVDDNPIGIWPPHEVGRNADIFDDDAGRLVPAGAYLNIYNAHLHSNGRDTRARLRFGFKFHPVGYRPAIRKGSSSRGLGNGVDFDIKAMEPNQQIHAYTVLQEHTKIISFEPHLHAPGVRMCLEAIWGINIQTLTCAGYDHNWVRVYEYADGYQPLLPKGTILHIIGYMDNSPANKNIPDPRNWQGSGNRSVANMFIDLGQGLALTDEEFEQAMAERRKRLNLRRNDVVIGCPLCGMPPPQPTGSRESSARQ